MVNDIIFRVDKGRPVGGVQGFYFILEPKESLIMKLVIIVPTNYETMNGSATAEDRMKWYKI